MLWVVPAQAHHAAAAAFGNEIITVEGVVNRMRFTNPHVMVYFDVTDKNGKVTEWVTEGPAATTMRGRRGWSRDTLQSGDRISVTGKSGRNGSPMVLMEQINLVHERTGELLGDPGSANVAKEVNLAADAAVSVSTSIAMTLADGRPNVSGTWVQHPVGAAPRPLAGGPGPKAGGPKARGPKGRGPRGAGPRPTRFKKSPNTINLPGGFLYDEEPQLSAEGQALQSKFDARNDPQVQCEPPGLVRQAGVTPHPFSIQQFEDRVEFAYEEYGGTRTVYFDKRDLLGGDVSRFGQSFARYEGDTLIIETTHVAGNWATPFGIILSDQTTTKESYSRLPDENGVSMIASHMLVHDPVRLAVPMNIYRYKYNAENYEFIEVDCQKPLAD